MPVIRADSGPNSRRDKKKNASEPVTNRTVNTFVGFFRQLTRGIRLVFLRNINQIPRKSLTRPRQYFRRALLEI